MNLNSVFSSRNTTKEEVSKSVQCLNTKKSCQTSNTPNKSISLNSNIFSNFICKYFSCCNDKGEFPNDLKHADIIAVYKKNNKYKKQNYRPVKILSDLSKFHEKLMHNQLFA